MQTVSRPIRIITSIPNSNMGSYYVYGNNMLLKSMSNQQMIQIPVSQLCLISQPQTQATPFNQY